MRISDWSSDVCSSDLIGRQPQQQPETDETPGKPTDAERGELPEQVAAGERQMGGPLRRFDVFRRDPPRNRTETPHHGLGLVLAPARDQEFCRFGDRSEEHTSELQSLMRISYAVFCLQKKKKQER